jgi:FdhD protein
VSTSVKKGRDAQPEAVRRVAARRISTNGTARDPVDEGVVVVREAAVTIDVEGLDTYTVLCTPYERRALALGFLLSEGVIESMADVAVIRHCEDDIDVIRVKLASERPQAEERGRNLLITSSCGACGSESLDERIAALPAVADSLRVEGGLLRSVSQGLRGRQSVFKACGGTHASGIFTAKGEIVSSAEDAGRHHALDKAIGKCLLAGVPTAGHGVALSGRVSMEMVGKCARAGIELITAISAPTTLAIDMAQRCNITLCAFVREDRATVFTHPGRVIGSSR